jgi:chitinase
MMFTAVLKPTNLSLKVLKSKDQKFRKALMCLLKNFKALGLKVDLQTENDEVIDAEKVLAENIKIEASAPTYHTTSPY